jgi:hypothetical protein
MSISGSKPVERLLLSRWEALAAKNECREAGACLTSNKIAAPQGATYYHLIGYNFTSSSRATLLD